MITIKFDGTKLEIDGHIIAEGESSVIEETDEGKMVGMAFKPPDDSKPLQEMVEDEDFDGEMMAMCLALLQVVFPGGSLGLAPELRISTQDINPWLQELDDGLPMPDIGGFAIDIPTDFDEGDDDDE